jgi:hypothetical protein
MSSNSDEVKSPTKLGTSGCRVSRPNSGTFSRKRDVLDQQASVCEKAAANIIAGVTPWARACANSASRVSGSSHCQRRLVLRDNAFRLADGSAGGSGNSGIRCDHQSRSAS